MPTAARRNDEPRSSSELMKALPEFTYAITAMWKDGDVLNCESPTDRHGAFEVAADFWSHGCAVEILEIERNANSAAPLSVRDVSAEFFAEYGLDAERTPAPGDDCDRQYDEMKEAAAFAAE